MVRIRRLAAPLAVIVALTAVLGASTAARAQTLAQLTVESFQLASDAGRPQVDVPFHLVVTLHVRERVGRIDNLELPSLAELELLGDERALQSSTDGTRYQETISVVAHHAGEYVIAPATLQAIDARDHRAKQYSSNGLRLQVVGSPAAPLANGIGYAAAASWLMLRLTLWILGTLAAIAIVVLLFRRRAAQPLPPPAPPDPSPPRAPIAERSQRDQMADALAVLRAERTRATAIRVRAAVWRMVGAPDGETLADVLHRPEAANRPMREVLRALERAAFTYDGDVVPAIDDACDTLERYLAA